jgi:hypothetical protein
MPLKLATWTMCLVFNTLEDLLNMFNGGAEEEVYRLYHKYWLHNGQQVEVLLPGHSRPSGTGEIQVGFTGHGCIAAWRLVRQSSNVFINDLRLLSLIS